MSTKKRKYLDNYIKYGFVPLQKGDTELSQCVICFKTLSNDGMRPTRLERHLITTHPEFANKPKAFFEARKESLKRAKIDSSGVFRQQTSNIVEASYEIALLIPKNKKSHTVGETLIRPSLLKAAELVQGKDSANKLSYISLSNDAVKGRIDNMSQDIKATDVFEVVLNFFDENRPLWDSLVRVCTEGAPPMLGSRSGFVNKVKKKSPSVVVTHCVIHREALASKTLPAEMRDVMNLAIKVVNFIKTGALNSRLFKKLCKDMDSDHQALLFHTNVRWLSKGSMLGRPYELREEVGAFLELQRKADLYEKFQSEGFQLSLAYLVDIFEVRNAINQKLQGKNINIIPQYDTIPAFMAKIDHWKSRMEDGNTACFANLDSAVSIGQLDSELRKQVIAHLTELKAKFIRYFPDLDEKRKAWKFIRNPFQCEVADVSDGVQEEMLELKFNSSAEDDFETLDLEVF
ncbi:protein ZBED8-like [Homarus americanus]|uniref:protein ZBED8-like n=1 Tax=Homarus americanus TaxID=6706 RepID=UPI001C460066|nr:protein ZBED8-like [Homarus americanus]